MAGHVAGGRPAARLLSRLGLPGHTDAILRHLKRHMAGHTDSQKARAIGIDEWAWRKGYGNYGTIIVDLERRKVLAVVQNRSADVTANWFRDHPTVEIVRRDRCGLYA